MVLEKTLDSPFDCNEIKPVNPKGNQSWIFIGRTVAEAEASCEELTHWKRPWCWERLKQVEKGMTKDEMVGWLDQWLIGYEFEQTPGDGEGQGSLACCSPWGQKSRTWLSDWTTAAVQLNQWEHCLRIS